MNVETVDLYRHFSTPAPAGAAGSLTCWHCPTPMRVSPHRRKPAVLILPGGGYEHISHGDPRLRERLSLEKLVRSDMPPVFLWHTRDDQSVPCRNSLVLAQALEEAGVDFSLHVYRHGQHHHLFHPAQERLPL